MDYVVGKTADSQYALIPMTNITALKITKSPVTGTSNIIVETITPTSLGNPWNMPSAKYCAGLEQAKQALKEISGVDLP